MRSLKSRLLRVSAGAEQGFDKLMFELRQRLNLDEDVQIVTYRSYGTLNKLYVKGRVLENKRIRQAAASDSIWRNIIAMYRRFESDEIPGAKLGIQFPDGEAVVTSDAEGYFVKEVTKSVPIERTDMWYEIPVKLLSTPIGKNIAPVVNAEVLVPPHDAEYGIISDIDDTIIKTSATNLLAMSRNTFFHNAYTRLPFAGVSEFYNALMLGRNGKRNNPFFYVSSSPWNLYDLLVDFLDLNKIPAGPLLLRDFGIDRDKAGASDHMGHKFKEIKQIFEAYPNLDFVLVGDSGQEDPAIYAEVVKTFPGRVLAIYIRDVKIPERERMVLELGKTLHEHNVEMLLVKDTVEAADHASKAGLIFDGTIPAIEKDKRQDEGEESGKEDMAITGEV